MTSRTPKRALQILQHILVDDSDKSTEASNRQLLFLYMHASKHNMAHTSRPSFPPPHPLLFEAATHMQESPPHRRFLVECSSRFIRLAEHLTALHVWCNLYLVGKHPTCPVPASSIIGMRGSMVTRHVYMHDMNAPGHT